jgi:hypothetical protein
LRDVRCLGFSKDFPPGRNVDGLGLVFFSAFAEKFKKSENIFLIADILHCNNAQMPRK